jgi:hypothetical protein
MGVPQIIRSFKVSEKTLLEIDDIKRALTPFLDNESSTTRLCIALTHTMLFDPPRRRDLLRSLQIIARANKGKTRTEEETKAIRQRYEERADRILTGIAKGKR